MQPGASLNPRFRGPLSAALPDCLLDSSNIGRGGIENFRDDLLQSAAGPRTDIQVLTLCIFKKLRILNREVEGPAQRSNAIRRHPVICRNRPARD